MPDIIESTKKFNKTVIMRLLYIKVGNRQLFVNRYTKRVPILSQIINRTDSIMNSQRSTYERKRDYEKWFKKNLPSNATLSNQIKKQKKFKTRPLISVLIPTYNTDEGHLQECIDSVIGQTYDNWELCIADDASTNPNIKKILEEFSKKDDRITYTIRKKNGHICEATNSALELAKGEFVALLDHDDTLMPNALFEVVTALNNKPATDFFYSDEDKIEGVQNKHVDPFFKPDWSPEFLRSINYITHFAVLRRSLVNKVGGFRKGYEGAQDWDLFLRISRETTKIEHIPKILYSWRKSETSTAQQPSAKDYAYVNQKKALQDDIKSRGLQAKTLEWEIPFSMWRVNYEIENDPLVSIIIPTKDQYDYIERCLRSVKQKTNYKNIEIVVVDTGSTDERVWQLYEEYKKNMDNLRVILWKKKFNFAAVCNFGAKNAKGEYFLFLNNDTEVITPGWVEDMLGYAQQKEIGEVGCKLLYPDEKLQHGGIILGVGGQNGTPGIAGHYFPAFIDNPPQDPAQLLYVGGTRNFAAVTAACVMVSKKNFNDVKGFDPAFRIAFNDVDLCLKLHDKGLRNVYLPHVKLYHYESVSVGQPGSSVRNVDEFGKEINMMLERWESIIKNDPYYHPEFRRDLASARLKV